MLSKREVKSLKSIADFSTITIISDQNADILHELDQVEVYSMFLFLKRTFTTNFQSQCDTKTSPSATFMGAKLQ